MKRVLVGAVSWVLLGSAGCGAEAPTAQDPSGTATVAPPAPPPVTLPVSHTTVEMPVLADDVTWGTLFPLVTVIVHGGCGEHVEAFEGPVLTGLRGDYGKDSLRIVLRTSVARTRLASVAVASFAERGLDGYLEACRKGRELGAEHSDQAAEELERSLGLSEEAVAKAATKVASDLALSEKTGAALDQGKRPQTLVVNGLALREETPEAMRAAIDAERTKAKEEVAAGVKTENLYATRVIRNWDPELMLPRDARERWVVPVGSLPALGPASAPVTIVELGGYQCPFCRRAEKTMAALRQHYGDKLRFVFRDAPLSMHKNGAAFASLVHEARAQKGDAGYWAAHDALMGGAGDSLDMEGDAKAAREGLERIASGLGLDGKAAANRVLAGAHDAALAESDALVEGLQTFGTPTFFVNGRKVAGAQPEATFRFVIELELKKAASLGKVAAPYDELQKTAKVPPKREAPKLEKPPSRGAAKPAVSVEVLCGLAELERPACAKLAGDVKELEKKHPGKIRSTWHVVGEGGPSSVMFHEGLLEVRAQKGDAGFFKALDGVLGAPPTNGSDLAQERAFFERVAQKAGANAVKLRAALDGDVHRAASEARSKELRRVQLRPPAVIIDGRVTSGDLGRVRRALSAASLGLAPKATPADKPNKPAKK